MPSFPLYEVSTLGRVRHIKHKKIRKARLRNDGYYQLTLMHKNGELKTFRIHKLVADAFIPGSDKAVIDHINRDRADNRLKNLRRADYYLNNINHSLGLESFIRKIIILHKKGVTPEKIAKMLVD